MRRYAVPGVSAVLALLVLMPVLGRGFVLNYDMVFAPRQPLVPDSLGLGTSVARSVPADAVMAVLTSVVPGDVLQKVILFLILFLGSWGAGRLVPTESEAVRVVAAVWYGWSAYLAERLLMGHWALLVAYACLPWVAAAALAMRRTEPRAFAKVIVACAPACITPTGGLLAVVLAVVCAGKQAFVITVPAAVLLNLPWILPSVLRPGGTLSSPDGVDAFAARAENWATPVLSVLGTGGIWNAEVTPDSRAMPLIPVFVLFSLVVAFVGLRSLAARWGLAPTLSLVLLGVAGVVLAVFTTLPGGDDVMRWAVTHIPGAGLLRDSQKWVAWWALPLAAGFALGVQAASKYLSNQAGLIVVATLMPVLTMPDLAWGAFQRLETVKYPADWQEVRSLLGEDQQSGDVLTLPLSAFRQFPWNDNRTQLDPAPRILPRTTVIDDVVAVNGRPVAGEDRRVAEIRRTVETNGNLATLGIGWVLVEHRTPGRVDPAVLERLRLEYTGPWLSLYRVPGMIARSPAGAPALPVVAADCVVLAMIGGALLWLVLPAGRFIRRSRSRTAEE
ncbi:hypothetical protein KIPE111705_10835 [Kibdelosporangium persicum]|uniref:LPXTG-motif cell wall anchor domain-containing protein n=1 Tax=Kibdelosporangium persicum TaxID=2698649 RepID=A0ABX2EZU9_9PSEU|nr:hypothetical protein [Kibdelosporangium persicum]NRN64198.1 LPXTG-motif cell wall anchor domain-containing protein [Kibdelosporangium persicum]